MTRPFLTSTAVSTASFDVVTVGTAFNDILTGGVGNNYIDGNGGYDTLNYAFLNQTIALGAQGVINKGLAGVDQAVEVEAIVAPIGFYNLIDGSTAGTAAALNINLASNSLQVVFPTGFALNFDVFNFVDVIGTSQNDAITGNFESNFLAAGAGNDYIGGSSGFDTLAGGFGFDTLDYSGLNQSLTYNVQGLADKGTAGVDQVSAVEQIIAPIGFANTVDGSTLNFSAVNVNLSTNAVDVVTAVGVTEQLTLVNFVNVVGSSQNDTIIGNAASNVLVGGAGSDYIAGVEGFDTLVGGTGGDVFALGDTFNVNYLGSDFATIADWNPFEDVIALNSTFASLYSWGTGNVSGGFALDTLLYYGNDVLAVIQDSTSFTAANFVFV